LIVSPRRRWRRILHVLALLAALALGAGTLFALIVWMLLAGSLPKLDGTVRVSGLTAPVRIERDDLGIPTLQAESRNDLAFATGFVHGQDRFFQMDLLRRHPAGELAELFGSALIDEDRRMRLHRFRSRAQISLAGLSRDDREFLSAYTRGVEAGRKSQRRPSFEYLLLGSPPFPWREEDTLLVAFGMFQMLQGGPIEHERTTALLDLLPPALAEFLSPAGSSWDSPMLGGPLPCRPIPEASAIDLRTCPDDWLTSQPPVPPDTFFPGSNNWALSGKHTVHGGAIVANDMHLGLFVPNIWYRVAFVWRDDEKKEHRAYGITLPGAPPLITGSNTHVAWGFTNTEGDFADLVILESVMGKLDHYRTPDGPRPIVRVVESINVKDAPAVRLVVEETIWGPVLDRDHRGRRRALRWVAHDPDAVNIDLRKFETARALEEVLAIAPKVGVAAQNLVVADDHGNIAWTILGRIPRRVGFDGRRPTSWADGTRRWDGWLAPADYPRIVNPPDGRLWSANNRVVGEPFLSRLGLGTYDLGARAGQIRDGLAVNRKLSERDMLAIQLDDRGLFLARWQALLMDLLNPALVADHPNRQAMRAEVLVWGGRADPKSVGFRLVKRFRVKVSDIILGSLTAPCKRASDSFDYHWLNANVEDSIWQLVTKRPPHLLPPRYESWDQLLLAAVDAVEREVKGRRREFGPAIRAFTQGAMTKTRIHHPFSAAIGPLAGWLRLNMPDEELPGDNRAMPRIQTSHDGASQRMAVSPGKEAEGYFHMPAGQSGHPLSPHYRDGHQDWAHGRQSPFLPGPAKHVLELQPG
jgi:penicillin amidase